MRLLRATGTGVAVALWLGGMATAEARGPGDVDAVRRAAGVAAAEALAAQLSDLPRSAPEVLRRVAAAGGTSIPEVTSAAPTEPPWLADVPLDLRPSVRTLWAAVEAARLDVRGALSAAKPGDAELARSAFRSAHAIATGTSGPAESAIQVRLAGLRHRVDAERLAEAAIRLTDAATGWRAPVRPQRASVRRGACATGDVIFEAPMCALVLGGPGPTIYDHNAGIIIDQGGADTYRNNAGGNLKEGDVALALDQGVDNDFYSARGLAAAQGVGIAGVGVLIDDGGNDVYQNRPGTGAPGSAQGAGFSGAGILWDRGTGDDRYSTSNFSQGIGSEGYGLLLDAGGSDVYTIPYSFDSEGGQGSGCLAGAGALVDQGTGDDRYTAWINDMQGMACLDAMGLLWDGGGSDSYSLRSGNGLLGEKKVVQSGWGQGYGELGAIGVLLDQGNGDDVYTAEVRRGAEHEGELAQGAAILGSGVLVDGGGRDRFVASTYSQGAGIEGIAVLHDRSGDDVYTSGRFSQGYGSEALGLGALLDDAGDDRYVGTRWVQGTADRLGSGVLTDLDGSDSYLGAGQCQGDALFGAALFTDLGGDLDLYRCGRAGGNDATNNATWTRGQAGVGIDR